MSVRRLFSQTLRPGLCRLMSSSGSSSSGASELTSSSSSSGACDMRGASCPCPVTPDTVWCGPSHRALLMEIVVAELFRTDMGNIYRSNDLFFSAKRDGRNGWKIRAFGGKIRHCHWVETRTETKDGLSMIKVNTTVGSIDIDPWRKIMKDVSDDMCSIMWL